MYFCQICNKPADIHHIVHRSEGGFDIEINYMYLCQKHHRGKLGPHQNLTKDIEYKIELQKSLYNLLTKKFYSSRDLGIILNAPKNTIKRITKHLKLYKEGFKTDHIIFSIMGNAYYPEELLQKIELENICKEIYKI
ncbi:HNH endonuclease signature motif containing protein [uncultured Clostridium sp.]|uniref:HNH endonuclease signature motif containing protein n=1 Tax=uncultured Clostridium sp. TaxID=59620 RepID=UPI00263A20FB|nr:HNH endonuclease signature motif containing protein [uncultured Clostridium sp.]